MRRLDLSQGGMLPEEVHREGGRQRLRVEFAPQALRLQLWQKRKEYPLDRGVAGLETVQDLDPA